jgi:hypothetical protein
LTDFDDVVLDRDADGTSAKSGVDARSSSQPIFITTTFFA